MTIQNKVENAPFKPLAQKGPSLNIDRKSDGTIYLTCGYEMGEVPASVVHLLAANAAAFPDRKFICERVPLPDGKFGDWRHITYGEMEKRSNAIAQAMIDHGMGPDAPLQVLSGNSINHATMMFAAMKARAPIAPTSVNYSTSNDHRKLKHVFETVKPKMIFVERGEQFVRALETLDLTGIEVVSAEPIKGFKTTSLQSLLDTKPTKAVTESIADIGHGTVAKYLFTSGSTGMPKGVAHTQGAMCTVLASSEALAAEAPPLIKPPPPIGTLEWMPWSHIAAGNVVFNRTLRIGGTLFLDNGRPVPGEFDETIRNLRDVRPYAFSSAPIAYAWLIDAMEKDHGLRDHFFARMRSIGYGSAALSQDLYERLQVLSVEATGERVPVTTMYGATETQGITMVHWITEKVGLVGLPMPGVTLKLVPNAGKLEIRCKGPTVMKGYYKREDLNSQVFDEEGFYKLGDAVKFIDDENPEKGLVYDGRVTEDFKLFTGTWVTVGAVRLAVIAAATPAILDCVICGHNANYLSIMAWLDPMGARNIAGKPNATVAELAKDAKVIDHIKKSLAGYNAENPASSRKIRRVTLLLEDPSIDDHETTDKGYINQRSVLERRKDIVASLYIDPPPPDVIVIE